MFWAPPASAHPHVWADMRSHVLFTEKGLIRGVEVEWTFDPAYSALAIDGLDANGDGKLSDDELAPLTALNLQSLKTYGYFVFMRQDGATQQTGDAENPGQNYAHGRLTLRFTVPLEKPVDPRKGVFMLKVYDPEFFIDFEYQAKSPVSIKGDMPAKCKMMLKPVLTTGELEETRLMLSTKGVDWKPGDDEDFGGMFAQSTLIACEP